MAPPVVLHVGELRAGTAERAIEEGLRPSVGRVTSRVQDHGAGVGCFDRELGDEPRLAHAVRTDHRDELARPGERALPRATQQFEFVLPPDERGAAGIECGREPSRRLSASRRRREQRGVVLEDRRFEVPQLGSGFHAELVDQRGARPLEGAQRVGLPSRAVLREHQVGPEALLQRMLRDERLELRHQFCGVAERESRGGEILDGQLAYFLEPAGFPRASIGVEVLVEGRSTPQGERFVDRATRAQRVPGNEVGASGRRQVLEPRGVERVASDDQAVSAPLRDDRSRWRATVARWLEHLAQPRDVRVDAAFGGSRRIIGPERLDELVDGDGAARACREHRQHSPLLRTADLQLATPALGAERAEDRHRETCRRTRRSPSEELAYVDCAETLQGHRDGGTEVVVVVGARGAAHEVGAQHLPRLGRVAQSRARRRTRARRSRRWSR